MGVGAPAAPQCPGSVGRPGSGPCRLWVLLLSLCSGSRCGVLSPGLDLGLSGAWPGLLGKHKTVVYLSAVMLVNLSTALFQKQLRALTPRGDRNYVRNSSVPSHRDLDLAEASSWPILS